MSILLPILKRLRDSSVLVIGDIMLDVFSYGSVDRISPEAPIPVLKLQEVREMLGGAGNVITNLDSLGVRPFVIGVVGEDENAVRVKSLLTERKIDAYLLKKCEIPTTTKTRFVAGNQQILRTDIEQQFCLSPAEEDEIIEQASLRIDEFNVIILSDYRKGALSKRVCESIIALAKTKHVPVFVDPKGKDYSIYRDATLIKPNQKELCDVFAGENVVGREGVYARRLIEKFNLTYCLVTLGKDGMLLVSEEGEHHLHSIQRAVFDVSGAGDTVIATLAGSYGAGSTIEEACTLSNIAAGIVVSKAGTSSVVPFEIEREISIKKKIFSIDDLLVQVELWRMSGYKIGFTNGCFDILHAGHVHTLNFARKNCDCLIVGLNADGSIRRLKGSDRPINGERERATILAELESVDALILFEDDTPDLLIKNIKPDVLIKGGDYKAENVVGYDFITSYGGKVLLAPIIENLSTTNILTKIRQL